MFVQGGIMKKEQHPMQKTPVGRRSFLTSTLAGAATVAGVATVGNVKQAFAAPVGMTGASSTEWQSSSDSDLDLVLGHDTSTLQQLEDAKKTFSDDGHVAPLERILAHHGATYIRERLWVNPPLPYNDLPHILKMAKRIKEAGLKFLLDIHYSDFWADPGHQTIPQAWQGQDLATLAKTVYSYTKNVIERLASQGTPVDMVQIGNEITAGMLWPLGEIYVNGNQYWPQFATLLKAGIAGAQDGSRSNHQPLIMVHIDRGGDNGGSKYFYDNIFSQGVDFDVIGLSYYPWWHGPLSALQANLNDLAIRYNRDIVVAETAYPWTLADGDGYPNIVTAQTVLGTVYPATPDGQLSYVHELLSILSQVPRQHGRGVIWWESGWIPGAGWEPGAGDAWDNMTLFDFTGKSLPSVKIYDGAKSRK
jgi:arabinogalactan endo-1,4-beta-galactosidase